MVYTHEGVLLIADVILWLIVIALFILSFVGIIFPLIPSSIALWLGFFVYHFGIDKQELGWFFWTAMVFISIILFVSDMIANSYFVEQFGGSKNGQRGAAIAVIVGSFITPPFGLIYVPFIVVLIIEYSRHKNMKLALKASIGSLIGFLTSTLAKVLLQVLMVIFFIFALIF